MTITLPPDLAELLAAAARARRTTPERFAESALRHATHEALEPRPPAPPPAGESVLDRTREVIGVADGNQHPRPAAGDEMFAPKPPRDPRDTPEAALARALAMRAAAGIPPGESMLDFLGDFVGSVEGDGQARSPDGVRKSADDSAARRKDRP